MNTSPHRAVDHPPPEEDTDASVIEHSLLEPERFAVIFDRHAPHIHRYLARRVGPNTADDLVAETFLDAFGVRRRYDLARQDARPWLYGIATNVISRHRRAEVRQYRLRQSLVAVDADHADRVTDGVAARALRPALATALAGLTAGDRDVLILIAWEDLTYEEVATALRIPIGTVRSRLNRARRKVRSVLTRFEELLDHG